MRFKNYDTFVNESVKREMKLPREVLEISELFQRANKKLFVVGGAVRDFLQNKAPKDFDLATDATPDESLAILKPRFKTMEVGKSFGVVIAVTPSGEEYEIATFRSDGAYGNSNLQNFIRYIEKIKPHDYEKRLHLLSKMSSEENS